MRGIVREFAGGAGTIAPRDGSPDVTFTHREIQTAPKVLMAGDEVEYEQDSGGAVTVVFKVH